MYLQEAIFINEAPFENAHFVFNDKNITVLSGVNGSGKTTLISYVVDAFYELAKHCFENEFKGKETAYYHTSSYVSNLNRENPAIVYLRFADNDKEDNSNKIYYDYVLIKGNDDKRTQECYENIKLDGGKNISYDEVRNGLKEQNHAKKVKLSKNNNDRTFIRKIFNNNVLTYFPAYRFELPNYLNDVYKIKQNFDIQEKFSGFLTNPIEFTHGVENILNWCLDCLLDNLLYKDNNNLEFINKILSELLKDKAQENVQIGLGRRFEGGARIAVRKKNREIFYPTIYGMSSGELSLFSMFAEILRQADRLGKNPTDVAGIVLIDEIDKHLHIKIQCEVLPKLLNRFPNIQFILTSHSPFFALGLSKSNISKSYSIRDLDNDGIECSVEDIDIFNDVYNRLIDINDNYKKQYEDLKQELVNSNSPLIVTEGKTDIVHLETALKKLNYDIDIKFHDFNKANISGDGGLSKLLENVSKIESDKLLIGIFDADTKNKFGNIKNEEIGGMTVYKFGNSVYAFKIPIVRKDEYNTDFISIEHYYRRNDVLKKYGEKRLFLGDEFFKKTHRSKIGEFFTIHNDDAIDKNKIIDHDVYKNDDISGESPIVLSKNDFATLVSTDEKFSKDVDFSEFEKIFDIIQAIIIYDTNLKNSNGENSKVNK